MAKQEKKGAYGMVYQDITRNNSLPLAAKGLYAYLAAFCGTSDECYPSVDTILRETGVSRETFYKYINVLVKAGAVKKQQINKNGRFGKTVYKLTHEINVSDLPNTISPTAEESTAKEPTAKNPTTNINNINNNNIKNNSNKKYMCVQPEVDTTPKSTPKEKRTRFVAPTEEEVRQYCLEKDYTLDAQRFVDFYECKGWMVGKNKMKNWKAAVRTWANKDQGAAKNRPKPQPKEPEEKRIDLWSEE